MTSNSFQTIIASRVGMAVFIFGKIFRMFVYLGFIFLLFSGINKIVGFARNEILLFLISFAFLTALGQMFFREAYRFRAKLVSGEFDFDLVKPIHPLFKNLAGGFDLLDLITMPIIIYILVTIIVTIQFSWWQLISYFIFLINGLLIMMAIHIAVMAFGIITTEVDNVIMVYRDLESMGRFPVIIYQQPLQFVLTYIVPVGIMFTVPVQAFLGLLSWPMGVVALGLGGASYYLSLKFWMIAVKKYSSASS